MKKTKLIGIVLATVLVLAMAGGLYWISENEILTPYDTENRVDNAYVIEDFSVEYTLREDSTYEVTERTVAVFDEHGHLGIVRTLPVNSGERYRDIRGGFTMPDGYGNRWCNISHENRSLVRVDLGLVDEDDGYLPTGEPIVFTLSYTLSIPETETPDETYLNIFAFGCPTSVENYSALLHLPAPLSDVRVFRGNYGTTETVNDGVEIADTTVRITASDLAPFEGLTLKGTLPDGTMKPRADETNTMLFTVVAAASLLLLAGIALLVREKSVVTPVSSFYPPRWQGKDLSPTEMGILIDGSCEDEDVTSLIFYWASAGYLQIDDVESKDPLLTRLAEPTTGNRYELELFRSLFVIGSSVRLSSLKEKVYTQVQNIRTKETADLKSKMYNGKVTGAVTVISLIVLLVWTALVEWQYFRFGTLTVVPLIGAGLSLILSIFFRGYRRAEYKHTPAAHLAKGFLLSAVGVLIFGIFGFLALHTDVVGTAGRVLTSVVFFVTAALCGSVSRRKAAYSEALNDIVGFRDFLQYAEKDQLEAMLETDPAYYYRVLPFAQVLGVSDKWENKFKGITMEPPVGIYGWNGAYSYLYYRTMFHSFDRSFRTVAHANPNVNAKSGGFGGGFGGGGFGGGGFGGGGFGSR